MTGRSTAAGVCAAIAAAFVVLVLAGPASGYTRLHSVGGYSAGHSTPIPPGAPRVPDRGRFLAGSPRIGKLRIQEIRGGPQSGRVLAKATVRYPHLRRLPAKLLSDRATYRGRLRLTLRSRSSVGRVRATGVRTLPLAKAAQGGRVTQRVVLSRPDSRRLTAAGRKRLVLRGRVSANFSEFGARTDDTSIDRTQRLVRVGRVRAQALGDNTTSPWPCAGAGDLIAHDYNGRYGIHVDYGYSGSYSSPWHKPLTIRLCRASDRPFNPKDWYALPDFQGHFPDSTRYGKLSPIRVEKGYVTVTWTPNPGWVNDDDHFSVAVNGTGEQSKVKDVFNFYIGQAPFTMRAMGDSITAGWGYLGSGKPAQLSGNDKDFDFPLMVGCGPPDDGTYNNRCSSNSNAGAFYGKEDKRFSGDTGLGNNVTWPAQFANRHHIKAQESGAILYEPYRNWAVSGGRPEHFLAGGKFAGITNKIVATDPDLTVLTLGANPLLANLLTNLKLWVPCGGQKVNTPEQSAEKAEQCMKDQLADNDVVNRLRAIYERLLEAPNNHVIVAPYPIAYSALPFEAATAPFVNNFRPFAIERMVQVMNNAIKRAVDDTAERLRKEGGGNRIFLMSPRRFNMGLPSYDQVINGAAGVNCPTYPALGFRVDGPSNQSYATQFTQHRLLCPSANDGDIYFESLDGGLHLSPHGAKQYADALDDTVRDIGLPVPPH